MVIVQHYAHSAKHYAEAAPFAGGLFAVPGRCPECQAVNALIRWGTYERQALTSVKGYCIRVQRVRCKACGRTHSLLPDFLHPFRHYVISLLQRVVSRYLHLGLGINALMKRLKGPGPVRSTIREWITSFAYGAGQLLFPRLHRGVMEVDPLVHLPERAPPEHFDRVPNHTKRRRLRNAYRFWELAEHLYAQAKLRLPRLHFAAGQLLCFVLHWLQRERVPPRIFWSPRLATTPTEPF